MSVHALISAAGAPGTTVTALSLVKAWHRAAVLVEADLSGTSVLPGFLGGAVGTDGRGLVPGLAVAHSHGVLAEQFVDQTLPLFESAAGSRRLLPGLRSPGDSVAAAHLWGPLGEFLRTFTEADAIIDAGRIGAPSDPRDELLARADQVLLVTGSQLSQVWAARGLVASRSAALSGRWSVVVVGPGRPYGADEVASAVGLPLTGTIAWDVRTAGSLAHGGGNGRSASGPLARSAAALVTQTARALAAGGRR